MSAEVNDSHRHGQIRDFVVELNGFAATAEATLSSIEGDLEGNKGLFSVFSERMIAIRGTAQQLKLPRIAEIAELGEEISVKGAQASSRPVIRKCVGALWDALTTVKHLLENVAHETTEEEEILLTRLRATLRALGGERPKFDQDEISKLIDLRRS